MIEIKARTNYQGIVTNIHYMLTNGINLTEDEWNGEYYVKGSIKYMPLYTRDENRPCEVELAGFEEIT